MWISKRFQPQISKIILPVSLMFIFIAFMLLFFPFRDKFQFDGDEGINLMKAMLMLRGYPLYNQIWSDQPPLLTYLLAIVFRVFGFEVNVARLTVLLLSSVLLGVFPVFTDNLGEFSRLCWDIPDNSSAILYGAECFRYGRFTCLDICHALSLGNRRMASQAAVYLA